LLVLVKSFYLPVPLAKEGQNRWHFEPFSQIWLLGGTRFAKTLPGAEGDKFAYSIQTYYIIMIRMKTQADKLLDAEPASKR